LLLRRCLCAVLSMEHLLHQAAAPGTRRC
jgi:hypothetical protein